MSDYRSGCHYDKKPVGERACPYNALYWDFLRATRARWATTSASAWCTASCRRCRARNSMRCASMRPACARGWMRCSPPAEPPNDTLTAEPHHPSSTTRHANAVPSLQSLPDGYRALVIGATGAIGSAFLAHLQADPRCALAAGLGRHTNQRSIWTTRRPSPPPRSSSRPRAVALHHPRRGHAARPPRACLKSAWAS